MVGPERARVEAAEPKTCAELCYTPMLHAHVFVVRDANYRRENLYNEVNQEDRPLIAQFCANDPEVFIQAALLAQDYCDAILNLGCPQMIAKPVKLADEKLAVPITCKIHDFPETEKTVKCKNAGKGWMPVHGRTEDQKGALTDFASWKHIKAVREAVNIPVFANGNIQHLRDVQRCMEETGVQGVMSAGCSAPVWEMAEEYLEKHPPCSLSALTSPNCGTTRHGLRFKTKALNQCNGKPNSQTVSTALHDPL